MSEQQVPGVPEAAFEANAAVPAGALLRAARESHGLTIDVVAQHLKLAPRQVLAIEEGDYAALPGRTFVRGFARNYARLMQLDPAAIMAALPEAVAAPALDKPSLGSSRPMGELPSSQQRNGVAWSRWAIPLAIAALIGVAVAYEFTRKDAMRVADKSSVPARKQVDEIGPLTAGGSPLPNPLIGNEAPSPATNEPGREIATLPATGDPAAAPGPIAPPSQPISMAATPTPPSPPSGDATLVIKYSGPSWTEVRDASGQRLLLAPGGPGRNETVTGTPPLEVTLGNAANASILWRGAAFDLAPHVKGNVARARLP